MIEMFTSCMRFQKKVQEGVFVCTTSTTVSYRAASVAAATSDGVVVNQLFLNIDASVLEDADTAVFLSSSSSTKRRIDEESINKSGWCRGSAANCETTRTTTWEEKQEDETKAQW